jgi:hypothetical protein
MLAAAAPPFLLAVAATVAIVAAAVAGFALRRRPLPEPHCPRCRYPMKGVDAASRCPECGFATADRGAWWLGSRRWGVTLAAAGVFWLTLALVFSRYGRDGVLVGILGRWKVVVSAAPLPGWFVTLEESRDPDAPWRRLRVLRGPETVWSIEAAYLAAGVPAEPWTLGGDGRRGFGDDLDGDGIADLVVTSFNAGSGGGAATHWLAIGDSGGFVPLATLPGELRDLDGDGLTWELLAKDECLDYRWTSGAGSPRMGVILTAGGPSGDVWRVSPRLMRKPAPPEGMLAGEVRAIGDLRKAEVAATSADERRIFREGWLAPLVRRMGELVYSGHRERAFRFLDEAWPDDEISREAFRAEFTQALSESPYAVEIEALSRPET